MDKKLIDSDFSVESKTHGHAKEELYYKWRGNPLQNNLKHDFDPLKKPLLPDCAPVGKEGVFICL
jgi:hypothetical protein